MNIKKQVMSYAGVNIINASIPFMLLPILTTFLSPSDYGVLSLIQVLVAISLPLVMLNSGGLVKIEFSKLSHFELQSLVSSIIYIPIFSLILLELLFYLFSEYISLKFPIPNDFLFIIPVLVFVQAIPTIVMSIFQAKKQPLNYGKYKISLTILNLSLSIILIVTFSLSWQGRLYGILLSYFIFSIIALVLLIKLDLLRFYFDFDIFKKALMFGVPFIPHAIASVLLSMSGRIFLASHLGTDAVGIYSVAFQVSSATLIVFTSINQAWSPILYEKLNNNPSMENKIEIVKLTYKTMLAMFVFYLSFISLSPHFLVFIINEKFMEAKELLPLISTAFLLQGFYFMIVNYIIYTKKTYILSLLTTFCSIVSLILSYYLIDRFGLFGSAYSLITTWLVFLVIAWCVSNKIYPMPWGLKS